MVITSFPTSTPVTVRLSRPLERGQHLWFSVQADTGGDSWHPARHFCTVTGLVAICDVLYVGTPTTRTGTFQVSLWLSNDAATQQLQLFAERPDSDNTGIGIPDGVRVMDNVIVKRG